MKNFLRKLFWSPLTLLGDSTTVDPSTIEPVYFTVSSQPTTGSTVTLTSRRRQVLLIDPSSSLLALTVTMPSDPQDNDVVVIGSSKAITTFTMSSAGTILGGLNTMAIGGYGRWIYNASTSKWFRIG